MKKILFSFKIALATLIGSALVASCSDDHDYSSDYEAEITGLSIVGVSGKSYPTRKLDDNTWAYMVSMDFEDWDDLNGAQPKVFISGHASVTPSPALTQDFSKDVIYTVTDGNGKTKQWKITSANGRVLEEGEGIGESYLKWTITADSYPSDLSENTIGLIGDYLVVSRLHHVFNRHTGEYLENTSINIEGVPNQVFAFTNDDAGNLIGATLAPNFSSTVQLFKWTSINQPPTKIYESDFTGGRKVSVRGDVNGTAEFTVASVGNNSAGTSMVFHRARVENGTWSRLPDLEISYPYRSGYWPCCVQLSLGEDPTYCALINSTGEGLRMVYGKSGDSFMTMDGPITGWAGPGGNKWGNRTLYGMEVFDCNGQTYVATSTGNGAEYFLTMMPADQISYSTTADQISYFIGNPAYSWANSNETSDTSKAIYEPDSDEYSVYYFGTKAFISCYRLQKVERIL